MEFLLHSDFIKIMNKLSTKDPALYTATRNKIKEIKSNDFFDHYKNLKKPLHEYKRVHITNQFVLIFKVDKNNNKVIFRYFGHRDNIYKKTY